MSEPSRRGPLPSVVALVFMAVVVTVCFGLQVPLLNSDGDLARHLRHGEYMLQHGHLISADPFSFTRAGQPFTGFEYGAQLVYALAHRTGGLAAVTVLAALLIAATYTLLLRFLLRRGVDPLLALGTTLAAAVVGSMHWLARPHLFSFLAVVLLLPVLEYERRPRLAVVFALFVVWANLHGGFLYGLVLLGIYATGSVLEAWVGDDRAAWLERARFYAGALGAGLVGSLVTPHGLRLYLHLWRIFHDSYPLDHTSEFVSPDFHVISGKFFLGALLLTAAALLLSRRRPAAPRALLLLAGIYFALTAQRNIALYGLTGLAVLALHLNPEWVACRPLGRVREAFRQAASIGVTGPWIGVATAVVVALGLRYGRVGSETVIIDRFDPRIFPVAATAEARAAGLTGRLFSDFAWGGYVLYAWPEQRVFIDGGTDFYGGALMRTYGRINGRAPGWRDSLAAWDIELVMVPGQSGLAHELARMPGWSLWHCDSTAVMLRRVPGMAVLAGATAEARLNACAPPNPEAR